MRPSTAAVAVSFICVPAAFTCHADLYSGAGRQVSSRRGFLRRGAFFAAAVKPGGAAAGINLQVAQDGYQVLTDGEVIELVGANRRDVALAAILQAYRRRVFGLAYSFVRNREAAEDVAQEVFIRVWRALPSFDARASLATWIYTIARNTSLSALRDRRREAHVEDPATLLEAQPAAGSVESAAEQAALMRLVDELPDRQRQVVLLYYLQEQSHEEVASMLAMPVGTVKTLLHRARARLATAAGAPGT